MAEQKCPMCGELNPAELEVCQFCQARLKPLIINQSDQTGFPDSKPRSDSILKPEGTPDWLRSLRDHQDDSAGDADQDDLPSWPKHEGEERPGLPTGEESIAPDWLDNLRSPTEEDDFTGESRDEESGLEDENTWPSPELESDEEAGTPDWLSGMRNDPEFSDQDAGSSLQDENQEGPDWLDRIRSRQQSEGPSEEPEQEPEQAQDLPDWLRSEDSSTAEAIAAWSASIRDRAEETSADWDQVPSASETPEKDEDRPGWLSETKDDEGAEIPPAEESPTWLKRGEDLPSAASDDLSDWMDDEQAAIPSDEEFPDWLETGVSPDEQDAGLESSNWMKDFSQDQEPASGGDIDWSAGKQEEALPAEGIPDWLQTTDEADDRDQEPAEAADVSSESEAEPAEDIPDWLQRADQKSAPAEEEGILVRPSESQDEKAQAEELPDWLQSEKEERSGPEGEIPDWLSDISGDEELSEEVPEAIPAEELPGWLAGLDQEIEADVAEAAREKEAAVAEPTDEIPDWLADIGPTTVEEHEEAPGEVAVSAVVPFDHPEEGEEPALLVDEDAFEEEVPDWLMDVKGSEVGLGPAAEKPSGSKDADLAPAELPSWLEAMRPVETEAAPEMLDERDRQVVTAGPLAGLRGVLPAEPEIAKVQKPPAYSVKLQISDMQRERAAMLEELVKAEGEARPIPGRPLVSSQHLLRMAFALILFLAILWPLVAAGPVAPVPVFSPETGAANQLIGQLNSQDPILVAVDYQPGLSGEMDAVASTLFDHLMLRGAYLTLVSTTASGPIQAEHLVALTDQQFGHSYLGAAEYTNLGYIPGGPTGLISFAANPRAMMAYALDDGRPAWENSPLQNVQNLSDFALVIVITENPETARAWIEQVQPALGDEPLIMAISAQAEPMVRPYYEAYPKQVQGMVVGLAGGAEYESLMGHPGLAHSYWNSFGIGLLAAIILIFFGGLFNMVPVFRRIGRGKPAESGESR